MRTGWAHTDPAEELRRRLDALRRREDAQRDHRDAVLRMKDLEREGDIPGVLIEGTCVDVTEGGWN